MSDMTHGESGKDAASTFALCATHSVRRTQHALDHVILARMNIRQIAYIITACSLAVLASSSAQHAPLVAYGLDAPEPVVYIIVAFMASIALLLLVLAVGFRKSRSSRKINSVLKVAACVFATGISIFGVYCMDFAFEKGQSNLRRLETYCRDLHTWQMRARAIRSGILEGAGLDPLPTRTPLNAVVHSRRERDGYAVENVYFESIPGFFVVGNLYRPLPSDANARKPVVLIPQGHFPHGRFNEDTQQLAATFARMGAFAFIYDMVGRGESTQVSHGNPHALTLQLWNSMRALDLLLALPDADPERVGMTGASGGGTQTFLCTAVDDRVRVSAPVVMLSSWVYGGCACEIGMPIHRGRRYATNNAEIAALAAPRPQLIVSIDADWTRSVPVREYPYIRGIYGLFKKGDNVCNVHLSGESHDYGPSKRNAVYKFFAGQFGLNLKEETPNSIEPEEAMRAFNAEHPRPESALQGWGAVMAAFAGQK
jgi:uncharacterized protein